MNKETKLEQTLPPDLYIIRGGEDYNRGAAVAAALRSQDRRIHAANTIKAFFQVVTGVLTRTVNGAGLQNFSQAEEIQLPVYAGESYDEESDSDSGSDDDDDVAAPAPAARASFFDAIAHEDSG